MNLQEIKIAKHLINNPHVRARKLQVASEEGTLVIIGQVESFFAKQMAQESIREFDGFDSIENRLEVVIA